MNRRFVENLEARRLFAVHAAVDAPADVPYDTYHSPLLGSFVSYVPLASTGGDKIKLSLKIANPTKIPQRGLVDLTFVLDVFKPNSPRPAADKFDPVLVQLKNVLFDVKSKGTQIIKAIGSIPMKIAAGRYWVAVALDPGGEIDKGKGFNGTIGAATTFYTPAQTDVTVSKFGVKLKKDKTTGVVSGNVSATLKNFARADDGEVLGNFPASGTVTLRIYASAAHAVGSGDILATQQTVTLDELKPNKTLGVKIPFDAPAGLTGTNYFIRIEIVRTGLPYDLDIVSNRNAFTSKAVPLK